MNWVKRLKSHIISFLHVSLTTCNVYVNIFRHSWLKESFPQEAYGVSIAKLATSSWHPQFLFPAAALKIVIDIWPTCNIWEIFLAKNIIFHNTMCIYSYQMFQIRWIISFYMAALVDVFLIIWIKFFNTGTCSWAPIESSLNMPVIKL